MWKGSERLGAAKEYFDTESGFWISWSDGTVNIGKDGENSPFLSYSDRYPVDIRYIGLATIGRDNANWEVTEFIPSLGI